MLMAFPSDGVALTPFVKALCAESQIVFAQEFAWNMDREQLRELQQVPPGRDVWSAEYVFKLSRGKEVVFCIGMDRKTGGSDCVGVAFKIKRLSKGTVSGRCRVSVRETKWAMNEWPLNALGEVGYAGRIGFEDGLLDEMQSLSMRIALHLF